MLKALFSRRVESTPAERLYATVVAQARLPAFYTSLGVPDSLDGRFELICLHCYLVLRRLRRDQDATAETAQQLVDLLFEDMDHSLREMGAGDLGVGKRVKRMAEAFTGRIAAYDAAWSAGPAELAQALERNLYGTTTTDPTMLGSMARYLQAAAAGLNQQETAALLAGKAAFVVPDSQDSGDAVE